MVVELVPVLCHVHPVVLVEFPQCCFCNIFTAWLFMRGELHLTLEYHSFIISDVEVQAGHCV